MHTIHTQIRYIERLRSRRTRSSNATLNSSKSIAAQERSRFSTPVSSHGGLSYGSQLMRLSQSVGGVQAQGGPEYSAIRPLEGDAAAGSLNESMQVPLL